ncbi:hypothetical protein KGQ71_03090 [Patescibacteria group bacterium]|nr:hypothetical protein [Patescibacteria group bacterium]
MFRAREELPQGDERSGGDSPDGLQDLGLRPNRWRELVEAGQEDLGRRKQEGSERRRTVFNKIAGAFGWVKDKVSRGWHAGSEVAAGVYAAVGTERGRKVVGSIAMETCQATSAYLERTRDSAARYIRDTRLHRISAAEEGASQATLELKGSIDNTLSRISDLALEYAQRSAEYRDEMGGLEVELREAMHEGKTKKVIEISQFLQDLAKDLMESTEWHQKQISRINQKLTHQQDKLSQRGLRMQELLEKRARIEGGVLNSEVEARLA